MISESERMNPDIGVLESCHSVVKEARHVTITAERLDCYARELIGRKEPPVTWNREFHLQGSPDRVLAYVFVLDALNFCFWSLPGEPRWTVEHSGEVYNGYWALALALKRAFEEEKPLWDPSYLSRMGERELEAVLNTRGPGPSIPLFEERLVNLKELGESLCRDWQGSFNVFMEQNGADAVSLVRGVVSSFPSFADEALYRERKVLFYKRAQILAGDLAGALEEPGKPPLFPDLEKLTAFADYKLPQILRHAGILAYSPVLAEKVDNRVLISPGSEEEVEIRAATVWAVEELRRRLASLGSAVTAMEIDWMLWQMSQSMPAEVKPYHLTKTVYY